MRGSTLTEDQVITVLQAKRKQGFNWAHIILDSWCDMDKKDKTAIKRLVGTTYSVGLKQKPSLDDESKHRYTKRQVMIKGEKQ